MKDQYAEFFYPDEHIKFGTPGEFCIIVALSKKSFMIKTMRNGWLRNTIKQRFKSFCEARIYCDIAGLEFKSKLDFFPMAKRIVGDESAMLVEYVLKCNKEN